MTPSNAKECYTMQNSIDDHHRTHTVRSTEKVSAWSGKYIHVGARAGWQVAPAQHSWQWILVRLSAECEPTGSVLRAEATDLECVKDASRTTLHSSQKLPSNQMARRRVAFPVRDVAPPWYQTTCYHFNIFQQQSPWVLLRAHEIQECFHVLGRLSSTVTAVLCNMWQVSNTFSQSGPSNIDQVSRCRSENPWIQIRSSIFCIFAFITTPNVLETRPLTRVEQDWIFSPSLARKIAIWPWHSKSVFLSDLPVTCKHKARKVRKCDSKSSRWSLQIARRVSASVLPASGTEVAFFNSSKLARFASICAKLSSKDCSAVGFCSNLRVPARGSNSGAVHRALSNAWDFGFFKNLFSAHPACTAAP